MSESEPNPYRFTVEVVVPEHDQPVTVESVGRQVEKMIENNSDWLAYVDVRDPAETT